MNNQVVKYLFTFLIIPFLCISCQKESVSPSEFVNWVESPENGLLREKVIGEFTYKLHNKPKEYIALKKTNPKELSNDNYEKLLNSYEEMDYYNFTIAHSSGVDPLKVDIESSDEYYLRLKYYSFEIENDFTLVSGGDTIPCSFSHFERTYGITPQIRIGLAFPKNNQVKDKTIIYNDIVFNSGLIKFKISKGNIVDIPKIKF